MQQSTFETPIAAPGEPHLACVLLVDTSNSMAGPAIDSLNQAINDFKAQTSMDAMAMKRVDVAIVEFNDTARVVQEFSPISHMKPVNLVAGGLTAMGAGINLAIDKLKERNRLYASLGTPCFKPWIFMITDGEPYGEEEGVFKEACKRLKDEEGKGKHGKLKFFALGVEGYNKEVLFKMLAHQASPRVMELRDLDFSSIFDWMAQSMVAISVSRVGDEATLPQLPDNARKADPKRDVSDW